MPVSGNYYYPGQHTPPAVGSGLPGPGRGPVDAYVFGGQLTDSVNEYPINIDPFGTLIVGEPSLLVGQNPEVPFDSNIWTKIEISGGNVASSGSFVLNTGNSSSGSVTLISNHRALMHTGIINQFMAGVRIPSLNDQDNIRRWGAFDSQNGIFFELKNGAFGIVRRSAGVDFRIESSSFNGILNGQSSFKLNDGFNIYKIFYAPNACQFQVNRVAIHTILGMSSSSDVLTLSPHFKLCAENINLSGSNKNVQMIVGAMAIQRLGHHDSRNLYFHISGSSTSVVKSGPGTLKKIIIGSKSSTNAFITLHDNIIASGNIMSILDITQVGIYDYDLVFNTGLSISAAGASIPSLTIVYT